MIGRKRFRARRLALSRNGMNSPLTLPSFQEKPASPCFCAFPAWNRRAMRLKFGAINKPQRASANSGFGSKPIYHKLRENRQENT